MRSIADTIARLSALQKRVDATVDAPGSKRFDALVDFGSNPGALKAWTYVPDTLPANAPLVVVLHGCLQSAAAYDYGSGWSLLADQQGFALLYPEQQRTNNSNLCFNWFSPEDTQRGRGEALSIFQMIEHLISDHNLDRRRIFVTGLSAGGAMAGVMLATYPEVFAAGAIIAGLPYGSARTIPEAFDRMRGHGGPSERELGLLVRQATDHDGPWPAVSIWQGSADMTVVPSNAQDIVNQWRGVHNLNVRPTRLEPVGRHQRRSWIDLEGREVLEEYTIAGMGHGTPLDTSSSGCGAVGPYMLDAGISSTQCTARRWGLLPPASAKQKASRGVHTKVPAVTTPLLQYQDVPKQRESRRPNYSTDGVRKVIEDALRTAGLMK